MLPGLPDLFAGCLWTQVEVFTIQGVNQPFPIHLKPERHCKVKPDCRVRQIRKFKIYGSLEYLSKPLESLPSRTGALLAGDLQVIERNFLAPIVSETEAQLSLESLRDLKPQTSICPEKPFRTVSNSGMERLLSCASHLAPFHSTLAI